MFPIRLGIINKGYKYLQVGSKFKLWWQFVELLNVFNLTYHTRSQLFYDDELLLKCITATAFHVFIRHNFKHFHTVLN